MELFADIPNLALAIPEMVMAVGAMVLLMIGVYSAEEVRRAACTGCRSCCSSSPGFAW